MEQRHFRKLPFLMTWLISTCLELYRDRNKLINNLRTQREKWVSGPASGFGSRRGWMESSTDQILIDKFLKNQNIYSDLTRTVLYCSNRYKRLALFQGVPWKSVRNRYSADVCFETAPPFLKLVTFFRQNNTKFCLRIDRDFHPGISNSWLSLFFLLA